MKEKKNYNFKTFLKLEYTAFQPKNVYGLVLKRHSPAVSCECMKSLIIMTSEFLTFAPQAKCLFSSKKYLSNLCSLVLYFY